jgi:CDP-diglyceride synthetase
MDDLGQGVERTVETIETVKTAGFFARLVQSSAIKAAAMSATVVFYAAQAAAKSQEIEVSKILPEFLCWGALLGLGLLFLTSGVFAWAHWRARRVPADDQVSKWVFRVACTVVCLLAVTACGWMISQCGFMPPAIAGSLMCSALYLSSRNNVR